MSLQQVKDGLVRCDYSLTDLKYKLNKYLDMFNTLEDSNCNVMADETDRLISDINTVLPPLKNLNRITTTELHIFFKKFNQDSLELILKIESLIPILQAISSLCSQIYELYKLSESMEFFLKYALNITMVTHNTFFINDVVSGVDNLIREIKDCQTKIS